MRYLTPVLVAATILSCDPASADLGDQLFNLLPDDGVAEDVFGSSVAMSGTTAIVGSIGDDENGINSGSVYLFDTTTGRQFAKLLANDGQPFDGFGYSVAIHSSIAIVGAFMDDDNGLAAGSAYLFNISFPKNHAQISKLLPDDGASDDQFGFSVGINGDTAIVGSPWSTDNGPNTGSAYLFHINTGKQIAKLLSNDSAANDAFGWSSAISGNTAIVGAYGDDDQGSRSGAAYLFDTVTGEQIAKLLPNDGAAEDLFGISVNILGTIAVVGAWWDDDNGENSGSAYLFDITTGKQIAKLLPDDGAANDMFGRSVSIGGILGNEIIIVGSHLDDDNGNKAGSAYLFDTSGRQIAKLLPNDGTDLDYFGLSVSISGAPGKEIAITGSFGDDNNGHDSGSAYLFDAAGFSNCPWDLDNSGSVDTSDLLELFAQWGTDGPADFDGSGVVDTSDLLILFANWGPCE